MNQWATFRDVLASWVVTFPAHQKGRIDRLLDFAEATLLEGARHEVFVVDPSWLVAPSLGPHAAHRAWLAAELAQRGEMPLFAEGAATSDVDHGLRPRSQIAYFDEHGSVVEEMIDDLGLLLRRLRPGPRPSAHVYTAFTAPVVIGALTRVQVNASGGERWAEHPIDIAISLYSDIWFPHVVGFLNDPEPPLSNTVLHDNRPLAGRHTPRLNRFLETMRTNGVALGAQWSFEEPTGERDIYAVMCDTSGIALE